MIIGFILFTTFQALLNFNKPKKKHLKHREHREHRENLRGYKRNYFNKKSPAR